MAADRSLIGIPSIGRKFLNVRVMGSLVLCLILLTLLRIFVANADVFSIQSIQGNATTLRGNSSFLSHMAQFPVDEGLDAIKVQQSGDVADGYVVKLLGQLLPYLIKEPLVPINKSCTPPKDLKPKCDMYNHTLFDGLRKTPAKIAVTFKFAFEADVLEIVLHQYSSLVSKIFLFESTRTHLHRNRKPLVWEHLRTQPRFKQFQNKIVHLLVDDAPVSGNDNSNMWKFERYQDDQLWLKLQEWNNGTNYFNDDDILMVGDLDEVPSLQALTNMKHCKWKPTVESVNSAIWFPFGNIAYAFQTDWPAVSGLSHRLLRYSLNAPAFWTWDSAHTNAVTTGKIQRMIGSRNPSMEGGMHLTQYSYAPYMMAKYMSISEGHSWDKMLEMVKTAIATQNITILDHDLSSPFEEFGHRIIKVEDLPDEEKGVVDMPWFLKCNLGRFPSWESKPDSRLD